MRSLSSDDIHYSPKGLFGQSKNLYRYQKWGLGRSPKRGEGGSPTFSPFPGERGLGIGIENKHFFEKTDFSYKLTARKGCFVLPSVIFHQCPCLLMNALLVSHPLQKRYRPSLRTITLASPRKRGGGLQTSRKLKNFSLLCDI